MSHKPDLYEIFDATDPMEMAFIDRILQIIALSEKANSSDDVMDKMNFISEFKRLVNNWCPVFKPDAKLRQSEHDASLRQNGENNGT